MLTELYKIARKMSSVEIVLAGEREYLYSTFLLEILETMMGAVDARAIVECYRLAPGVIGEFNRTRKYIESKEVSPR